jgi:hypothetical protein
MKPRLARLLLRSYPPEWRDQYGQELEDLLCRRAARISDILDVLWSGFVERMRQPSFGLWCCLLAGSALTFLTSLLFADPLWRILTIGSGHRRATRARRETHLHGSGHTLRGHRGSVARSTGADYGIRHIRIDAHLGMDLFFSCKGNPKTAMGNPICCLFRNCIALSAVLSFLAWRNGSIAKLLQLYPDVQNAPLLSVGHCFLLLAASTMGVALLLQIPIVTFFVWRFRGMQDLVAAKL